jgi:hypothetical protein
MYNGKGSVVFYDVTVERVKGNARKKMREIGSGG